MPSKTQKIALKRKEKLPISLEQEHKHVYLVLKDVQNALKQYNEDVGVIDDNFDPGDLVRWYNDLLVSWEVKESDVKDEEIYLKFCQKNKIDRILKSKAECEEIYKLSNKLTQFKKTAYLAKKRLSAVTHNHLIRYCVSCSTDLLRSELKIVQNYDQSISEWQTLLNEYFDQIKSGIEDVFEQSKPFGIFLENSKTLNELMDSVIDDLHKSGQLVKDWLRRDREYVKELHESMLYEQHLRDKEKNRIPSLKKRYQNVHRDYMKRVTECEKAIKEVKPKKRQKFKLKQSRETIEKSKDRNREEILVTEDELDKVKLKIDNLEKWPNRSDTELRSYFRNLGPLPDFQRQADDIRDWLTKLDENDRAYCRQMARLSRDRKQLSESIYEDEIHITELEAEKSELEKSLNEIEEEIKFREIQIENHEQRLDQFTRIYDLKVSPDTLRKIYNRKRLNQVSEKDNTMIKACDFVSEKIGEDWKQLYVKLPFLPKRAMPKRRRDVQELDDIYASPRNDASWTTEARRGLERWRLMNRRGNVHDLVASLKRTGKENIADELIEAFVPASGIVSSIY